MNRKNKSNDFLWIFFLIFIFGGGAVIPLFLVLGVVLAITFAAVSSSNRRDNERYQQNISSGRTYNTTGSYYRSSQRKYTPAQMAKINIYLRNWFRNRMYLPIGANIDLRIHGDRYTSLAGLDVYRDGTYICSLNDFGRRYPESYDEIINELIRLSSLNSTNQQVMEAEINERPAYTQQAAPKPKEEPRPEPKKEEPKAPGAADFIATINQLNDDIPDEDISNGLYETCALLKQIETLQKRFPDSKDKLKKLYDYYLPILVRILQQYVNLQAAKTDPSYRETENRLKKTIGLINDAMKTIISGLTDQDFINLSADIATLEAVLQKDGLTSDGQITQPGSMFGDY
ncbi:MAG: hypothetical protein K6G61_08475 [Solobacterium sp.]|nr:hypothetical protein [Solobacterium sp.]